ncbi:MAG: hypothetical protein P9X26_07895 [Candidatus Stygibacter frigidus]|nr:hypothetical protein [Candidatus Stygibacter frigidus]
MNNNKNKHKTAVTVLVWLLIAFFVYLIAFGGQFSYYNRIKSNKIYKQALARNDDLRTQNEYLEKDNSDMDNEPRVQIRNSAEIGYKKPDVQIIKKTKKRNNKTE